MPAATRSDVLLVGGGVAAARCARTLRRHRFDGSITLVGTEERLPYNRPPLSKELLRDDLPDELVLAEPEAWYRRRRIDTRVGATVVELDPDRRRAKLDDGAEIAFERCLLATGAEPRRLPIDGGEGALLLRSLRDARRLRSAAVAADPGAQVTVIGGGFIGVEVASSLATLGVRPTIVEMAHALWGGQLGTRLSDWARERLADAGITVRLNAAVTRIAADAASIGDERLGHAFAVAGIGVVPRVELADRAGLELVDGVVADGGQRTSRPVVWAAGDIAATLGRRVEHWHAARESGERAALSMLGLEVPPVPIPWLFSEVAGTSVDVIGSVSGWDDERWVGDDLLAYLDGGRTVQLAVIGSALDPAHARDLVGRRAAVGELERALSRA
ncbi:MAG: FAD-dependent oxidoreductase [Chloroflexota bacterium]|nr:FAD-dependent oxidoreductase [Chloroflexota bacterium]